MLYVTTKSNKDAFTAFKALSSDIAPDGGLFYPFSMPVYDADAIAALGEKGFSQIVAEMLNKFFSTQLSTWDIDFTIGRCPVKLVNMNHRIAIAELWHNPNGDFSYIVRELYNKVRNEASPSNAPTEWFVVATKIAVLFGVYGELLLNQITTQEQKVDVAVPGNDYSSFIAAFYAKTMGLPIGMIICTSDDSGSLWEFIHRGVFTPSEADYPILPGVERLLHTIFGSAEVQRFKQRCEKKLAYTLNEEQQALLIDSMFCCVTSQDRVFATINSVFRSNSYIIDPKAAWCYGGLQDYRAKTGAGNMTLLLSETTPLSALDQIAAATGIGKDRLPDYIKFS